jgi:acyl-CoA thioester hydrolase
MSDEPRDEQLQAEANFSPMPYEVDFTGFLSNTVAPRWLERMRLQLIADHFDDQGLFDRRQLSVIARSEIDYLRPVRMGMRVVGRAWIERCLRTSWTIRFTFREADANVLCMRALQVGVFINPDTFNPVRVPPVIAARVAEANH